MLTPRLSKDSAGHLHRESWDVRPHLHAHGWRRSDGGDEFVEVFDFVEVACVCGTGTGAGTGAGTGGPAGCPSGRSWLDLLIDVHQRVGREHERGGGATRPRFLLRMHAKMTG